MKTVFSSHSELAHVWANSEESDHGRAGNMFFRNGVIFSYGEHFPIAKKVSENLYLFTTRGYSNSTEQHKNHVRRAIPGWAEVIPVRDPTDTTAGNVNWARSEVERLLMESKRPRIHQATRDGRKSDALKVATNANRLIELFPQEGVFPIPTDNFDAMADDIEAEIKRQEEHERQIQRIREEKAKELLVKWRAYEDVHVVSDLPPALRLSEDGTRIETSWGAQIPANLAPALWKMAKDQRKVGRDSCDLRIGVGHYQLRKVKGDGSIVVGCHDISYDEIHQIAIKLNLVEDTNATE